MRPSRPMPDPRALRILYWTACGTMTTVAGGGVRWLTGSWLAALIFGVVASIALGLKAESVMAGIARRSAAQVTAQTQPNACTVTDNVPPTHTP
jgi:hypothetical protein